MSKQVWVDYPFSLEILPVRARKTRWNRLRGSVPVEIREIAAFENDRALVDAYDRNVQDYGHGRWGRPQARKSTWTKGNRSIGPSEAAGKETVTSWCAGHDGRLWRPVTPPVRKEEFCTVEAMLANVADPDFKDHPFVPRAKDRENWATIKTRDDVLDQRVKEVRTDTEEYAIARALRAAEGLVLLDGGLWRAQVEPVFVVERTVDGVSVAYDRPYRSCLASGVAFPVTQAAEAMEFAQALRAEVGSAARRREVEAPYRRVLSADPAFLALNMGACSARLLGNAAMRAANEYRNGPGADVAGSLRESLGNEEFGVDVARKVGDPYAFAERLGEWAGDLRSLPRGDSYESGVLTRFEAELRRLAEPFDFGRAYGLRAQSDAVEEFMTDDDLAFLASLDEELGPAPGP